MILPHFARNTVGVVAVGARRYIDWLAVLYRYVPIRVELPASHPVDLHSPQLLCPHRMDAGLLDLFPAAHQHETREQRVFRQRAGD